MAGDLTFGIRITADGKVAVTEVDRVKGSFDDLSGSATKTTSALGAASTAAKAFGGVIGGAVIASVVAGVKAFAEAEEVSQRLAASLSITGGAANRTVGEIDALAQSLQNMTRFDDEGIKRAATTFTRFSSITGAAFDRAIVLSADLAEALGRDVPEAAETLGKALENAAGATMLARLGLLNDSQAQAIKLMRELGDESGAQTALFEALESRVGGLAAKMGDQGLASAWSQLKNQIGESLEGIGKATAEFTNLEGILRGLSGIVSDLNAGGLSKIVDVLSGTSFSYSQSFAQGDRSAAAQDGKFELLAQQAGRAANDLARERNQYLAEQDKAIGELILKEQKHSSAIKTKADIVREVTAAWNNGNTTLVATYGTLDAAIARITAAIVKKGAAAAKAKPQIESMRDAMNRAHEDAMNWIKSGEEVEKMLLAGYEASSEFQKGLDGASNALRDALKGAEAMVASLETETDLQKLSNVEREISIRLLALEATGIHKGSAAWDELAERIRKTVEAQHEFSAGKKALEDQERAYKQSFDRIGDSISDALMRGFESGADMARSFRDSLIGMFKNLVLRPIIQAIVAPAAGGIASLLSGGASANGLGGLGSLLGGGGGAGGGFNLSSLFGGQSGGGLGGVASGLFSSFALSGAGSALGLSGTAGAVLGAGAAAEVGALAAGTAATLTTLGTAALAAIPVVGWIAAAGLALYAAFGSDKGGPKTGGSFSNIAGAGRFFTPDQGDEAARKMVEVSSASFASILGSLGGRGSAGFGFGFDTDPEGDAPSRISASASVGGREVFGLRDLDVGRDEHAVEEALALASKQALLAALQASELPRAVGAALNTVLASTADDAAIDSVLGLATAFKALTDAAASDPVAAAADAWTAMQRTSMDALRNMGSELSRLATEFDGSAEGANALAAATNAYGQAVAQTIVGIRVAGREIGQMFANSREQIEAAGLGRDELYTLLQARADRSMEQALASEDASQIQGLAQRINSYFLEAFNLLSPEEQGAGRSGFLENLNRADEQIGARLASLIETVGTESKTPFESLNIALDHSVFRMEEASKKQVDAADRQAEAAEAQLTAAETMLAAVGQFVSTPLQVSGPKRGLVNS